MHILAKQAVEGTSPAAEGGEGQQTPTTVPREGIRARNLKPFALLAPFLLLLLLVFVGLAKTVAQSLGYVPEIGNIEFTFEYFADVLSEEELLSEAGRSIGLSLATSLLVAVLGTLLGWCITTVYEGKGIFFHISKLPMLMPYTVTCLCLVTLLSSTGLLARAGTALGWEGAENFFGGILFQPNSIGVLMVFVFAMTSYFVYMTIGIMNRISSSLGDAAMNLGASRWQSFRRVVLPVCMPTIRHTFIFVFVAIFGNYEVPMLVANSVDKLLPVRAYAEYSMLHLIPHRPMSMVVNVLMLAIALLIVLLVHLWDVSDRKRNGL